MFCPPKKQSDTQLLNNLNIFAVNEEDPSFPQLAEDTVL